MKNILTTFWYLHYWQEFTGKDFSYLCRKEKKITLNITQVYVNKILLRGLHKILISVLRKISHFPLLSAPKNMELLLLTSHSLPKYIQENSAAFRWACLSGCRKFCYSHISLDIKMKLLLKNYALCKVRDIHKFEAWLASQASQKELVFCS